VKNGDPIIIDAEKRQMTLGISATELKKRKKAWGKTHASLPTRRARKYAAHGHERLARRR